MRRRILPVAILVLAVVPVAACGEEPATETARPNVVVIMTDDQTLESMRVLALTNDLLGDQGTTFTQAVTSFPLCCPSRATFLTGQYAHNHGVEDNVPPDGGYQALDHSDTLPVWLQEAGYTTSHVGKYLNAYSQRSDPAVPPGWDRWFALTDPSTTRYFDYDVNDNGEVVHFGTDEGDYQTDVLADRAVEEIEELADGDDPFYLQFWPLAPHTGRGAGALPFSPAPAPRHLGELDGEPRPRTPGIDETDIGDKPAYVEEIERALAVGVADYNRANGTDLTLEDLLAQTYRRYLESLLAVDEAVERIVDGLDEADVLDDTVIVFTSDNGWTFGEHRLAFTKVVAYEESLRVPLLIRGPGFEAGREVDDLVANVDLAATIAEVTGASAGRTQDGRSLVPAGGGDPGPRRAVLLESPPGGSTRVPHYVGVRTPRFVYAEYDTGEAELYDLRRDPSQLTNVADDPGHAPTRRALAELVDRLQECAGTGCIVEPPRGT